MPAIGVLPTERARSPMSKPKGNNNVENFRDFIFISPLFM